MMAHADDVAAPEPLRGIRVLEACETPAGRVAGMLLADLGAEVVRVAAETADEEPPKDPGELCWDRGKRLVAIDAAALPDAACTADVLLVDRSPRALHATGLAPDAVREQAPGLVHVWAPPYAGRGEFSELPADPILLDALGVAGRYPSRTSGPVAPVVPTTTYVHGAMTAAAAVAGLVGRRRHRTGTAVEVGGLHAVAAQMTTMMMEGLDQQVFSPGTSGSGPPCWRPYRCADGRWFFLAALTPGLFFRALEAHPGLAGGRGRVLQHPRRGCRGPRRERLTGSALRVPAQRALARPSARGGRPVRPGRHPGRVDPQRPCRGQRRDGGPRASGARSGDHAQMSHHVRGRPWRARTVPRGGAAHGLHR